MLDQMFQRNASKFAIHLEYKNSHCWSMLHRPGHSLGGKNKLAQYEKHKKSMWVFVFQKYGKF